MYDYERICYHNNCVYKMVCRLDFASPIHTLNESMPKEIYNVVKKHYPIAEPQDIIGAQFQIGPSNGAAVNRVVKKQWVFLSRDRSDTCTIEAESIVFLIKNYNVFEAFRESALEILTIIMNTFPENQSKRFGLRYVNDFQMKGHNDWIDAKFFNALSAHKDEKTTRLITTLEYAILEKDLGVRLQYGYVNPDYPAIIKRENFVVDIDAYSKGVIYCDDLAQLIDDMHYEDQKCFEKMITDSLRSAMNEKE